jgi:tRNA wybutosine-synthesizing protein 3
MMQVDERLWRIKREEAYRRFLSDLEIGYVDRDIKHIIELIFSKKYIFSTSSCSGRITIVDALYPWQRDEATVIFKKHEPIDIAEIEGIIRNQKALYRLWMIVSGPILHINALNLDAATTVLTIARNAGFKHSGIISIGSNGIIIEIVSGIWVPFLLKDGDDVVVKDLSKVVKLANTMLLEGKQRLEKLFKFLKDANI